MSDAVSLILQSALGTELSHEEAEQLGELMRARELADSEYLISEGATDDSLHLVLKGKLEVVKRTAGDEETNLAILREGDLAGELSFIDGEPHTVGLRALCDSRVFSLRRGDFEAIIETNPRLVYKVMRAITRSAHRILHRMNSDFVELRRYLMKQHGRY